MMTSEPRSREVSIECDEKQTKRSILKRVNKYKRIRSDEVVHTQPTENHVESRLVAEYHPKAQDNKEKCNNNTQEYRKMALLIVLYMLQGVPLGLSSGSVPFMLKEKMSYSKLSLFSLAGYPYSLKLFWSPIVDSVFNKSFGRRKSWIVPVQMLTGLLLWRIGGTIEEVMINPAENIIQISLGFFFIVLLSATQDIAVDGWALTLLSEKNLHYASTCQTIGLNIGYFMSFTVLLALNGPEFSNRYLRSEPQEHGVVSLGMYMRIWAIIYGIVTLFLIISVKETETQFENENKEGLDKENEKTEINDTGIIAAYRTLYQISMLPQMKEFILVLLISKIGFIPNDLVTQLKLLEKGYRKEDMSLAVLIDFPIQIVFGYYAAKWSSGKKPMRPWRMAFIVRIAICILSMITVYLFPQGDQAMSKGYFGFVLITQIIGSMASTVQFVALSSFITLISDPVIGGTYMTFLNTLSNFGGTWPGYFVLKAVDLFTFSYLYSESGTGKWVWGDSSARGNMNVFTVDGYYITSLFCMGIGLVTYYQMIKPMVCRLECLPLGAWRIGSNSSFISQKQK